MKGQSPIVTADAWLPKGEAVGIMNGHPIAIWQGIPGEKASVQVYRRGSNRAAGRWEAGHPPHPARVAPACDRYSRCGGCALMHLSPEGQYQAWTDMLVAELAAVGLEGLEVASFVPSPDGRTNFRHMVKLAAGWTDREEVRVGAFGRNSRDVVPIPKCLVATPELRSVMSAVAHHTRDLQLAPYDPHEDLGVLRYFVLRQSRSSGDIMITIVAGRRSQELYDLAERVVVDRPSVTGVHLHLNREVGNAFFVRSNDGGNDARCLNGKPYLEDEIAGIRYRIGPTDFFQTNPGMADRLYRDVVEAIPAGRPLVDLYCGVGGLALAGARKAGWAIGVEHGTHAVAQARLAAQINGVSAEFLAGDVAERLTEVSKRVKGKRPHVVANPARRGLDEGVVSGITEMDPASITYISCNRRTFARDLREFVDQGFIVEGITPYEMFPQTAHCEVVAQLRSPNAVDPKVARGPRRKRVR